METTINKFYSFYKKYIDIVKDNDCYIVSFKTNVPIVVYNKLKGHLNENKEIVLEPNSYKSTIKTLEFVIKKYCIK